MPYFVMRWLVVILLLTSQNSLASEAILDYFSDIQVQQDGGMVVEETIEVRAEGDIIQRGIFRDFPTDYTDRLGTHYRVDFELLEVRRDGKPEPYHTERRDNGIRIYVGNKNVFLKPGNYRYSLRYTTRRQLGFFEQHDELYWNVTGNGWAFPIQKASARVQLPNTVPPGAIQVEGYTGAQGATGQDYRAEVTGDGDALFETTALLPGNHGLTIVVSWPKGHVVEPDQQQKLAWFMADNQGLLLAAGGLLLLLAYYLIAWFRVGRDPQGKAIIPLYEPAKGYSPASMRFVRKMGYDDQTFGAAIINMAVKGYLTIKESKSGTFTLTKTGESPKLAPGEAAIASALFSGRSGSIDLKQKNHVRLGKALKAHKNALKRDYEKIYFLTNSGYIVPGVLITLALLVGGIITSQSEEALAIGGFMMVWLSIWTIAVYKLALGVFQAWRSALHSKAIGYAKAIVSTLFALPFFAGEVFGIGMLTFAISLPFTLVLLIAVGINFLFYEWLKAPTLAGQKLLQQVEGFRLYLSVAEQEELDFKHPVKKTPELFEAYLPYAIALDVEQQWAERFSGVLAAAGKESGTYHPGWYSGRSWSSHNLSGFTTAMGSAMGSAISASSSAPGSSSGSSGSSGGGSSGGGGGGGGGGGW